MKKIHFSEFNKFLLKYDFYSSLDEEDLVITFYNKVNNIEIGKIFNNGDCYIDET